MNCRIFCTYFDKNYLYRGLVLYFSLEKYTENFTLYILCMDEVSYSILEKINLRSAKLIKLVDFEDDKLRGVKDGRSTVEYYWTCTPSLPLYIFNLDKNIEMVTYLDSDLMFFSSPEVIFDEIENNSILAVEHRYPEGTNENTVLNGKYCVQYVTFRRDGEGTACLKRWRDQCINWCYYRQENGLMGDQAYLSEWDSRYKNLHSVGNLGVGLAPWNIFNYNLKRKNGKVFVNQDELVFFHYHAMRYYSYRNIDPSEGYTFSKNDIGLVYKPYFKELGRVIDMVHEIDPRFHFGGSKGFLKLIKFRLRYLLKPMFPFLFKK